jgi:2-methylcitrate dehydratase PrpD
MSAPEITRILARFVVASKPGGVPERAVHEGRRAMLHWIGCSLGGCRNEVVQHALDTYTEFSGKPQASVLGRRERVDILLASLVNAMSSDVLGFSDTHLKTVLHPGGVVGPVVLALAERTRVSGADLLHAFLLGMEVTCRIGVGVFGWHYGRGWHITGTVGTFGAAAAAGKLLGLDEERMIHALGIAATEAAGLREGFGSMCKSLNPGRAAQNGLSAALLAANGFTSTAAGIEGRRGFAHVLGDAPDLAAIIEGLGTRYEILSNTYKPFPCGVVIHPLIDGCITLAARHTLKPAQIESVALRVNPLVVELTGRPSPATTSEAKLSAQHSAAAALCYGRVTEEEYRPACVTDAGVAELRARVTLVPEEGIRDDEAHVGVRLRDGRRLELHVEHAVGSERRPMSDADIETKVRGLAEPVLPASQVDALIEKAWQITALADAGILARLAAVQGVDS